MIDRLITEVCQVDSSPNSLIFKEITNMSIFNKHDEIIDVSEVNLETGKHFDLMKFLKKHDPEFYQKIIDNNWTMD